MGEARTSTTVASDREGELARLLAEHARPLERVAAAYARSAADREDLLQDFAVALWQALPAFRGESSERTYVLRIAHNRAVSLGTMTAAGTGLDAFVELTRRRLDDDLRWSAFVRRAMQVMVLFIVPWAAWAFVARREMYRAEPWRAVVGFGGAALIWGVMYAFARRKRAKLEAERERFLALVAERTAE